MSRNPIEVPDHLVAGFSASKDARAAIKRQQALDWTNFLSARSAEMADGARLVSLFIGATPELHGWNWVFDTLWQAALSMEKDGLLSQAELTRFTCPAAGRGTDDLKALFADGPFQGLMLEHAEVKQAPDPFWEEFLETHDAQQLGRRWAGMMRAVTGPIAATAFAARPNRDALVDELYRRMEAGIAAHPQEHIHFVAIAVVRKVGL